MFKILQTGIDMLRGHDQVKFEGATYRGRRFDAKQITDLLMPAGAFEQLADMQRNNLTLPVTMTIQHELTNRFGSSMVDASFAPATGAVTLNFDWVSTRKSHRDPYVHMAGHIKGEAAYMVAQRRFDHGEIVTGPATDDDLFQIERAALYYREANVGKKSLHVNWNYTDKPAAQQRAFL